jgi:hypothetical protein
MNIAELFGDLHGTINPETLEPLSNNPHIDIFEITDYLGIDEKYLWENPKGIIHRYFYWDELYLTPINVFDIEGLVAMYGTKEEPKFKVSYGNMLKKAAEEFHELKAEKNFVHLFDIIDKKVLFYLYNKLYKEIPDEQKWDAYKEGHVRAENGFDMIDKDILNDLLTVQVYKSPDRPKRLQQLKDRLKDDKSFLIYHGHNEEFDPKDEMCWTLNYHTAKFFAHRFENEGGTISQKTIVFDDVLDYFDDRKEAEIILKIK